MKFALLKKHLQTKEYHSAYLISGDDAYVVQSAENMFKNIIEICKDINISNFINSKDAYSIIEDLQILPILDQYRLVIVTDYKGDTDLFLKYLENPNKTSILVFVQTSGIKENFSKLITKIEPVDCNKLEESQILSFIANNASIYDSAIEKSAALTLMKYCSNDLTRISRELEKLALFKYQDVIRQSDVEELVNPDTDYKIFELSEAVANKQSQKAISILSSMQQNGTSDVSLLGLLYSHFRRLFYCSLSQENASLASLLNVKEYAVKKTKEQAKKYSPRRLKAICDMYHKLDYDFKNGFITDSLALQTYMLSILNEN